MSVVDKSGTTEATIKQNIAQPIFVASDGKTIVGKDLNNISYKEFTNIKYILLPKTHWFAKNFVDNPFQTMALDIALVRPTMWGHRLVIKKEERNGVLFSKMGVARDAPLPNITKEKFDELFKNLKFLAKGGFGEVSTFSHNGVDYAFKKNANELRDLELLQFTRAVVEIYGGFKSNNTTFLVMMKGTESLDAIVKRKGSLDDDLLKDRVIGIVSCAKNTRSRLIARR